MQAHASGGPLSGTLPGVQAHLAQFNTATLRHPLDHDDNVSFIALLDGVNAAAEASPGFVWRHGIDSRDVNDAPYVDPLVLVNASVWASPAHLRDYVYKGIHLDTFRRRADWFVESAQVMWWVPAGEIPTMDECMTRLAFLQEFGPSPYAFRTSTSQPQLLLRRHELDDPVVQAMLQRLNDELRAATPDGGTNFFHVAAEHVSEDNGAFVVAWLDGQPRACGAWRRIDDVAQRPGTAEVKRMWADPEARGLRLGAAVLASLEAGARHHGITELRLETGEYLTAAVGLYRRFGFQPCEPWGEYVGVPHSYTMSKPLLPR